MKHKIKQALCGAVVLTGLFLAVVLPVGLTEADRYGQALLAAAGCFTAVHIAAKAGGMYWAAPGQAAYSPNKRSTAQQIELADRCCRKEKVPRPAEAEQGSKTKYITKSIAEK